jgi:hypothetical protein
MMRIDMNNFIEHINLIINQKQTERDVKVNYFGLLDFTQQ